MPLVHGYSFAVIQHNTREMVAAGHPPRIALAAAMHIADQSRPRRKRTPHGLGTGPEASKQNTMGTERLSK